jgi:hypothetical protein
VTLREVLDRYGPTAAVLVVLGLLIVLLPGNAQDPSNVATNGFGSVNTGAGGTGDLASSDPGAVDPSVADAPGDTGALASTAGAASTGVRAGTVGGGGAQQGSTAGSAGGTSGAGAQAAPGAVEYGSGPNCRSDGRQKAISLYASPCANWKPGTPNGGATSRGVSADAITVVRYRTQSDPATQAALQGAGANDSPEDTARMVEALRRYYNHHTETYGREVKIITVQASGKSDNDEAMKSDAIKIANEHKAFAAVGLPGVAAQEAAARGVICMCTTSQSSQFYQDNPPYIFSDLPTGEHYGLAIADYMHKRLWGKPAKHSSDPTVRAQTRKFGSIYFEGSGKADPYYQVSHKAFLKELSSRGMSLAADVGYVYELSKAPDQATSIIAKMKSAGVNHVIFTGDPLMPIFLTKEATRQAYFPEWMITGTALVDTTFFGRTYDQAQWRSAFGMSPLPVFWEQEQSSPGYREYHHGMPGEAHGREGVSINVVRSPWNLLFRGIHMAGPNLTPDTFSKGMFSYPRTGGTPANPLVYYTREHPTSYKDMVEVWWDPNRTSVDETGKTAPGSLMKANQGQRYEIGKWTPGDPMVFGDDQGKSIYTSDNPPGGRDPQHEQDGHTHPYDKQGCLSCAPKG